VLNARSGSLGDADAAVISVRQAFVGVGLAADIELASGDKLVAAVERATARAARGEVRATVVGGGDGTVSAAAGLVAGTGIPLGILPFGTLNHFARDAGIPSDLAQAAAVIAANRVRLVDIGAVNDRTFVNNSSIGIYPQIVFDREKLRRKGPLGKWPAMFLALLRVLRRLASRRLRVRAGGVEQTVRTPLIFIGNNQYGMDAFALGRRVKLDGGELWLYVVRSVGVFGLVRLAARLALGLAKLDRDLIVLRTNSATIDKKSRRGVLVALDGEIVTMEAPLRYTVRPRALALLVPDQ